MAKLLYVVYSADEMSSVVKIAKKHQLPISNGDLMMLMDLNWKGMVFDQPPVKGKELEEFTKKYNLLTKEELKQSLEVTTNDFTSVLSQTVPCVGCRRSVERLFYQLMLSGHPTLDPITITNHGVLTITKDKIDSAPAICTLLHKHNTKLTSLLENQPRNKKSSRCGLHSLDSFRSRPFSEQWLDVWNCMKKKCRKEVTVIEKDELHATLDGYLKKHKFCQECRTKVEKAYNLLVNDNSQVKEKGYVAALYSCFEKCDSDKHIHLSNKIEHIDNLIKRAEPELNGSSRHRERHAKTLEIAQEEVLTCVGMCIYERFRRIHMCVKEEENACQVLAAVSIHALCRSFDMSVEKQQGISNLELLYEEITRAEKVKEQRKEQKKLKKKKKKSDKKIMESRSSCNSCEPVTVPATCICSMDECDDEHQNNDNDDDDDDDKIVLCDGTVMDCPPSIITKVASCCIINNTNSDVKDECSVSSCHSCDNIVGGCTKSIDCGYMSEPTSSHHDGSCSILSSRTPSIVSSPEGSEIACSDGFCNHESGSNGLRDCWTSHIGPGGLVLTLQQMLDHCPSDDDGDDNNYIPDEMVDEFKLRQNVIQQQREELRQNLRRNFAQLCLNKKAIACTK